MGAKCVSLNLLLRDLILPPLGGPFMTNSVSLRDDSVSKASMDHPALLFSRLRTPKASYHSPADEKAATLSIPSRLP